MRIGRSGQPWNGYDYDTLADDLADVMAATGADSDAAIVGFSNQRSRSHQP